MIMENRINIAELLQGCPKGMALYSPIFGEVYLDKIRPHLAVVVTTDKEQGDFKEEFLYDGRYGMKGECMLFPSKGKTTWEGFHRPFSDGDVVAIDSTAGAQVFVFKEDIDAERDYVHCYMMLDDDGTVDFECGDYYVERFATEEEKQKLFQAIKDNGYNWNAETKTLEKLITPKFKVGDKIVNKNGITKPFVISQVGDGCYYANDKNAVGIMRIEDQDNYVLILDKFDITTLVSFESRVLVRDYNYEKWFPGFWGCYERDSNCERPFITVGWVPYKQCIPYEGNEHLLGKTDDCSNFYKTWEELWN